jgi:glycosyltransferase involved in cell wall biosynthesis
MVLDGAYTLRTVHERGIRGSLLARNLGGYFRHVWSVHPLVGADPSQPEPELPHIPRVTPLGPDHTVIEAAISRWRPDSALPKASFAAAQGQLLLLLDELLSDELVTVIRAGDPYYLGLLGLLLARLHGRALAVRVNGNYDEIYEALGTLAYPRIFRTRRVEKLVDRLVLSRADIVFGANQNNLEFAVANGADPQMAFVSPYGNLIADVHFSDPATRARPAHFPSGPTLLYVGRREPVKYPQDVIGLLAQLTPTHPELHAVLIGEGSMTDQLRDQAARLHLSDRVHLLPSWDQTRLAQAYAAADVVVAPHMGRALVEAALSATPIVAYDNEWHGELIEDGVTGYLVPFRDVEALAARVSHVLQHPEEGGAIGVRARAQAEEQMDPERLQREEITAYQRLLSRQVATT